MSASISQVFFEAASQAFGSNLIMFAVAVIFFAALFFITRQSLASSLLLGIIAMEGLQKIANEPFIDIFTIGLRILILGVIAYGFATTVFKK